MEQILTPTNVMFIITFIGIIFSIWFKVKEPQEKLEKNQLINDERDKSKATVLQQKEAESKAILLAEQVKWDKDANEKKFADMGIRLDSAFSLAQNHIHTVDTKVDELIKTVGFMSNELTRLSTILKERLPKRI